MEITSLEFRLLKDYLYAISGIAVPPNKRYLFNTRLAKILEADGYACFSEFYTKLVSSNDATLQRYLVQAMATHESSFLRDKHPFAILDKVLLPAIARRKIAEAKLLPPRIRIFSAGCSLGQEPYSIAMIVHAWLEKKNDFQKDYITIVGADISRTILERARKGIYSDKEIGSHLPEKLRKRYIDNVSIGWEVKAEIKQMVKFMELNLSEPFKHIGFVDIIFCRNVIIYFPLELKKTILQQFYEMLNPGGALIMGASESTYNLSDNFRTMHEGNAIYYVPNKEGRIMPVTISVKM